MPDKPGMLTRISESVGYIIRGVTPNTWMSPMQPREPMAPEDVKGRQYDFPVGQNLNYRPRSTELVGFAKLRALAEHCNVLRIVLERQKDLIEGFDWQVKPRETQKGKRPAESAHAAKIKEIEDFLKKPDQVNDWSQWLRMVLEDVFVLDAPAIYVRLNRGGGVYALEPIDGATITPLIDETGRRPLPPSPAYQQILKGVPAADFGHSELIYYPKNPRTNRLYGSSPVQWIVDTAETSILRMSSQKAYFTAGNINDGIFTGPEEWGIDQIKQWQRYWDDLFEGNLDARRHGKWVPGGTTFEEIKTAPLKDEFDEWIARIVCFAFSTSPAPFINIQNRGNQENQQQVAEEGGIVTYLQYIKRLMNRIIWEAFQAPELEFAWEMDDEFDAKTAADMDDKALEKGAIIIDEWRDKRGLDPLPNGLGAVPIAFGSTPTKLEDIINPPEPPMPVGGEGAGLGEALGAGVKAPAPNRAPALAKRKPRTQPRRFDIADPGRPVAVLAQHRMQATVAAAFDRARASVIAQIEPKLAALEKAAGDTLYVHRKLTLDSAEALSAWAIGQGFTKLLPIEEMHATIVYSRAPVILFPQGGQVVAAGGDRSVEALGDEGAIVLRFESERLSARWQEALDAGAAWDYAGYKPHVTITYDSAGVDLAAVEPYLGDLIFGPEVHAPITGFDPDSLRKAAGPDVDDLDLTEIEDLSPLIEPFLRDVAVDSGEDVLAKIGVDDINDLFDRVNTRAVNFAKTRAAELVGKKLVDGQLVQSPTAGITETTRELLRNTITKGLQDNIGSRAILDEIRDNFAFSDVRARMIAITEINRANSQSSLEAARETEEAGVKVKKIWLLGQDPCDECQANAEEGALDLADDFQSGDDAPPAHPNCYCSLSYEVGD